MPRITFHLFCVPKVVIPKVLLEGPKSRKWKKRTAKKRLRRILSNPRWAHEFHMMQVEARWAAEIREEEDERILEALDACS